MYTIADLAAAAEKEFGYPPFLVVAALRSAGKKKCTLEEARAIIEAFANAIIEAFAKQEVR